jgi:hypothetical protein
VCCIGLLFFLSHLVKFSTVQLSDDRQTKSFLSRTKSKTFAFVHDRKHKRLAFCPLIQWMVSYEWFNCRAYDYVVLQICCNLLLVVIWLLERFIWQDWLIENLLQVSFAEENTPEKSIFLGLTARGSRHAFWSRALKNPVLSWSRSLYFQSRGTNIRDYLHILSPVLPGHTTSVISVEPNPGSQNIDTLPADEAKVKPLLSLQQVLASIKSTVLEKDKPPLLWLPLESRLGWLLLYRLVY